MKKKVVEKIKEERQSFFFFSFSFVQDCLSSLHDVRAAGRPKLIVTRKIHSIQLNSLSIFTKFTHHARCCYFSVKAKSEYAHHQTNNGTNKVNTERQKEKEFI